MKMSKAVQYIIILVILFTSVDAVAFYRNTHSSFFYYLTKKILFEKHLLRAHSFYDAQTYEGLQSDEMILFAHAYPNDLRARIRVKDRNDPFMRMIDREYVHARPTITKSLIQDKQDLIWHFRQWGTVLNHTLYSFDTQTMTQLDGPYDDILLRALYCDFAYTAIDSVILESARDGNGGYVDTHQLMALVLQQRNECSDADKNSEKKITETVRRILKAQENEKGVSDLFVERIVVLFWAGRGNDVRHEWMQRLVDAQKEDGGWGYSGQDSANAHTTGLSAIALRYYLRGDGYQDIFVR